MKIRSTSLAGLFMLAACLLQPSTQAQQGRSIPAPFAALDSSTNGAAVATVATAPGCVEAMVSEHVNWLQQQAPNGTHVVRVTAASNQRNGLVSYSEGLLTISSAPFPPGPGQPPSNSYTLAGTLTQYFSDRKFGMPSGSGISLPTNPFAPQKTDQLGLSISTSGQVSLTLKSWGNKSVGLTGVDCASGVLYGLTNTGRHQSFYVISLRKDTLENPPPVK